MKIENGTCKKSGGSGHEIRDKDNKPLRDKDGNLVPNPDPNKSGNTNKIASFFNHCTWSNPPS